MCSSSGRGGPSHCRRCQAEHGFHKECLKKSLILSSKKGEDLRCPKSGCSGEIDLTDIEWAIGKDHIIKCKTKGCSYVGIQDANKSIVRHDCPKRAKSNLVLGNKFDYFDKVVYIY